MITGTEKSDQSTQLSNTNYASSRKELLQLVQKLREIGAQAIVDVPRVVVIGNQSAGKSSVVEAISGKQVVELAFGDVIHDPKQVELALRRAQAAVLNPHIETQKLLGMSAEQLANGIQSSTKPLLFSRNVVCVHLQGPDLTDLSFIDLPGLIQVAEERSLLELVESLVIDHIKGNSLILVTVPMTDDLENQKALTLAREVDPEGMRTMGVLTKPDLIGKGSKSRDLWLEVIEGRSKPLLHGYFCTRQPDDDEREKGITALQARQTEELYFDTHTPWSTSTHRGRFGVKNLVTILSPLLENIIKNTLPQLSEQTSAYLKACESDLSTLPEAISTEPATFMTGLITSLCDDIREYVKGGQGCERLIQENRQIFARFKQDIRSTTPNFTTFLDEDEHDVVIGKTRSSNVQFFLDDMRAHIERSVTRQLPNNVPFPAKTSLIVEFQSKWADAANACFSRVREITMRVLLECVKSRFGRWANLHAQVRACITDLVKKHYDACQAFISAALEIERTPFTQNTHYLQTCKEKWLTRYIDARAGRIAAKSGGKGSGPSKFNFLSAAAPVFKPSALASFSYTPQEKEIAEDDNDSDIDSKDVAIEESAHPSFALSAESPISPGPGSEQVDSKIRKALACLAEIGYTGLGKEDLARLNKPDSYQTEMEAMAEVRGYFQVAYKALTSTRQRIIDYIPSFIDLKFVNEIMADIHPFLLVQLKLGMGDAAERCKRYLAEDPNVVARREELLARKVTLENVKSELYSFGI
ncbi:hypothetical protein EW146_g6152 [Bondarzewia mesenterica]|uniref:GED domain-containing protein n=1 Tax=Bondarzewia mesenterica TaxID=1095465 RepID=A0A4S4LRH8_9AGAM|nr:hypothetical protein EW146_g6152 [Bondarzewia mesenterica]